jgi:hypothetical protein
MADFSGTGNTGNTAAGGARGRADAAERFRKGENDTTAEAPPAPSYITWLHTLAPTNSPNDVHHRLGTNPWDATPGPHQHLGTDGSVALFDEDEIVTGDLSNLGGLETAVKGILSALSRRGLTDQTT